jgi:cytochrome c oxidase assembly protein subunit 15
MKKHFPTIAKIALVLVYLVIVAGALVRMTGSGMGCPDWPK